jgi:hypothetical protein
MCMDIDRARRLYAHPLYIAALTAPPSIGSVVPVT